MSIDDLEVEDDLEVIEEEAEEWEREIPLQARASSLLAHCGTNKISFDELKLIPIPAATRTHVPVAHYRIVDALVETLAFRHIVCVRSEFAVSPDGMRCFGVLDLDTEWNGCRFSIGIRNSNDKSLRLGLTIGYRVFVCDNLAFKGDFTPVLAKHSKSLELADVISVGVDKMQRNFAGIQNNVLQMQQQFLSNDQAKLLLYESFLGKESLGLPMHLMREVAKEYFKPSYDAFNDPTLFSLSNAFTTVFKKLKPVAYFQQTARLGEFIEKQIA